MSNEAKRSACRYEKSARAHACFLLLLLLVSSFGLERAKKVVSKKRRRRTKCECVRALRFVLLLPLPLRWQVCQSHPRFSFVHVNFLFPWPEKIQVKSSQICCFEIEMKNALRFVHVVVVGCDDEMKTSKGKS